MTYGANLPNYVSSKFVTTSGDAMIKASGATHIRWPGGNYANMLIWDDNYSVCPAFTKYKTKNSPGWTFTWRDAATFAQQEGVEVLWQMNAAIGLVCGPNVAAAVAAKFVTTATAAGVAVNVIEVGNENYGKWEAPYKDSPTKVSPASYAQVCTAVVNAVKNVKSSVIVGCVGDIVDTAAPNTPFLDWNAKVLNASGTDMDFLIIHEYYTKVSNGDVSPANLLHYGCRSNPARPNCGPLTVAERVKADVAKYAPARQTAMPVMITEYNMQQPFQAETWSLVEGLFTAKHLGDSLQAGLMGSTFFAMANGDHPDFGMFSRDAHQIAYAPVFSFAIFTRVAPVGSWMLSSTLEGGADISAYAFSLAEEGYFGMVLVNAAAHSQTVSLDGPWDNTTELAATIYTLTASSQSGGNLYSAASFAYNGVRGPAKGGPLPLDQISPKRVKFTGSITLDAVSVTGFVITPAASPFPPNPPPAPPTPPGPPTPPAPAANECCHASCGSGNCHSTGFCVASSSNCVKHCSGVWCPGE